MGAFNVSMIAQNDAPRLNISGDTHLTSVAYGAVNDPGTRIDTMLATGANGAPITDPDSGALLGIAVTGVDTTYGSWEYTVNGTANWTAMPAVSPTSALLLNVSAGPYTISTDVRVRFIPSSASFAGTISNALTFRAWDQGDFNFAGGQVDPTSMIGDPYYYSTNVETASITVTGSSVTPVTFSEPPVSDGGKTVYGAISPGTPEGVNSLLAAFSSPDPFSARAFSWDGITQDFVELPTHPTGGVGPETGFFIATRATLPIDFAGSLSTMPYNLTLQPGWNLLGVPPLDDPGAGTVDQTHSWDSFALYDETMALVTDPVVFTNVLGTPASSITTARPYYWDGATYTQVMTLETGKAYWFKNNASTVYTLQRTNGAPSPVGRALGGHAVATGVRGTITDRGAPPAPPTSGKAKAAGGCGAGSAIGMIALGLAAALRGLGLRRRRD
jgi:hypothetical protein